MRITLSPEQQELQQSFRALFEKQCPTSLVRELQDPTSDGFPDVLWGALVSAGLFGLPFPTEITFHLDFHPLDRDVLFCRFTVDIIAVTGSQGK